MKALRVIVAPFLFFIPLPSPAPLTLRWRKAYHLKSLNAGKCSFSRTNYAGHSPLIHDLIYGRQDNRILRLSFPNNDPPSAQFVVDKIDAKESLSKDFEFTVELLCDDASIALKEMQGKLLNIELVRKDGSLRYFSSPNKTEKFDNKK